jgi:BMFP domain-containing protein YqiC
MIDPRPIDEIARRISAAMPPGLNQLHEEMERTVRAVLQGAVARLDLVSREEFEVQSALLARTRSRLETLERRVAELEAANRAGSSGGE